MFYLKIRYSVFLYRTLILLVLSAVIIGCSTSDTEKSDALTPKAVSEKTPIISPEPPTPTIPQVEPTQNLSPATVHTATRTEIPAPRSTNLTSSIINLDLKTGLTEKFPEDISGEILSDGETDISIEYIYPDAISDTIPKGTVISFKTVNDDDDILQIHIPENWQKAEDEDWFFGKQANILVEVFDYKPEDLDSFADTFLSQNSSYVERTRVHNILGVTNALYEKKYRSSLVSTGFIKGVRPFQIHWFLPIFSQSPKIALIRFTANPDHIDATIPMFASTMNSITVKVNEVLPINTPLPAPSQDFDTAVNAAMENLAQLRTYLATIDLNIRLSGDNFLMEMPINLSFSLESEEVMSSEMSMSFGGNEETLSSIRMGDDIYQKENNSPWVQKSLNNLSDSDQYIPFDRYFRNLLSNLGDGYSSSLTQTISGDEYTITMDYIPEFIVELMEESFEYDESLLKGTTKYSINRNSANITKISFNGIPFSVKDDRMGEVNVEINASYTFSEWNKPTIKIAAPASFINVGETYSGSLDPAPVKVPAQVPTSPPTPTPTKPVDSFTNMSFDITDPIELPEELLIVAHGNNGLLVYDVQLGTFVGPSDPVPFGWVNAMDSSPDGDLFVSFNTTDGQHYWGECEEAGCRGIISINTSSFSVQKGFNKAKWLLGGPIGGGDLEYLITDILYHDGKLYIATDSKRHMVQVIDSKSGASLGQINLPEFHPAAIALSLNKQDLLIVSAEDSKIYQMNVNSPTDSIQEYADFAQYMEQGGGIRMEFSPNDGVLMLANFHKNLLIAFQAVSGKYLGGHTYLKECDAYTDNNVCGPLDLEFEPSGTLFISNWNWGEVSKYSSPNYKEQELVGTVSATAIEYMNKP